MDRGATTAANLDYVRYAWAVRDGDVDQPQPIDIIVAQATPAVLLDTQTSQLSVVAVDAQPGPQALTYQWKVISDGGTLSNTTSATVTYMPRDVTSAPEGWWYGYLSPTVPRQSRAT